MSSADTGNRPRISIVTPFIQIHPIIQTFDHIIPQFDQTFIDPILLKRAPIFTWRVGCFGVTPNNYNYTPSLFTVEAQIRWVGSGVVANVRQN